MGFAFVVVVGLVAFVVLVILTFCFLDLIWVVMCDLLFPGEGWFVSCNF